MDFVWFKCWDTTAFLNNNNQEGKTIPIGMIIIDFGYIQNHFRFDPVLFLLSWQQQRLWIINVIHIINNRRIQWSINSTIMNRCAPFNNRFDARLVVKTARIPIISPLIFIITINVTDWFWINRRHLLYIIIAERSWTPIRSTTTLFPLFVIVINRQNFIEIENITWQVILNRDQDVFISIDFAFKSQNDKITVYTVFLLFSTYLLISNVCMRSCTE